MYRGALSFSHRHVISSLAVALGEAPPVSNPSTTPTGRSALQISTMAVASSQRGHGLPVRPSGGPRQRGEAAQRPRHPHFLSDKLQPYMLPPPSFSLAD